MIIPFLALAACSSDGPEVSKAPLTPSYDGIETRLLDGDLVNFRVAIQGADQDAAVQYAECAAAQYTLIRGYGFARHVRTTVDLGPNGGLQADAVYTISPDLPRGAKTIDAEVVVADCSASGIPTV